MSGKEELSYYECLHRSLETFCDSTSSSSSSSLHPTTTVSKSRMMALIQNIQHELCQLSSPQPNNNSNNDNRKKRLLNVPMETIQYAIVSCEIMFQIILSTTASNHHNSNSDSDSEEDELVGVCVECISTLFGSLDESIVFEIFRMPIVPSSSGHDPSTPSWMLMRSILNRNHNRRWYTSKKQIHTMLIIFRGFCAMELVHRYLLPTTTTVHDGDNAGFEAVMTQVGQMAMEYLSQGEDGWKDLNDHGYAFAMEAMESLAATIRSNHHHHCWIPANKHSKNEDLFERFVFGLHRLSKQCQFHSTTTSSSSQSSNHQRLLELKALSLSILLHHKSSSQSMDGFQITERLVQHLLQQVLEEEHHNDTDMNNAIYQVFYNLTYTRNHIFLSELSNLSIPLQDFIVQQLMSSPSSSNSSALLQFLPIMNLSIPNQFRKLFFTSLQQIGTQSSSSSSLEPNSNDDQSKNIYYANQKVFSYLANYMFQEHFSFVAFSTHVFQSLLFGPRDSYRNDTLALYLWETLESSAGTSFVTNTFCHLIDLISNTDIDQPHSKPHSTKKYTNLPITGVIADILAFILSSKKCSLHLMEYLTHQSNGYDTISIMARILKPNNKPSRNQLPNANNTTPNSLNKTDVSSLTSIYMPNSSDSSSLPPSIQSPTSHNHQPNHFSSSDIDIVQISLQLSCASIIGKLIIACMNNDNYMAFTRHPINEENNKNSFSRIKQFLRHTLREFIMYASPTNADLTTLDNHNDNIIDTAILQTKSKDLTIRAVSLQSILSQIYYDEYNFGKILFETHSALVTNTSTRERELNVLKEKCEQLSDKTHQLEHEIIFSKSISEKERIIAVAHARSDSMALVEAHLDAKEMAESRSLHYKEKLGEALSQIKTSNEMAESIRQKANKYSEEKEQLAQDVRRKETTIGQLEEKISEYSGELSRNRSEIKALLEKSKETEEKCSKLISKKSELQVANEDLYNTKEDAYYKLIALAQIYEKKQEETDSMKQDLLDELRSTDEAKLLLQKKYDRLKEKAIAFQEENDSLKRKLEKAMKKLHEASQRRPIGPVAYINKLHSNPNESQRNETQRYNTGKENDYSFASSSRRTTNTGRKSNFRIVK